MTVAAPCRGRLKESHTTVGAGIKSCPRHHQGVGSISDRSPLKGEVKVQTLPPWPYTRVAQWALSRALRF